MPVVRMESTTKDKKFFGEVIFVIVQSLSCVHDRNIQKLDLGWFNNCLNILTTSEVYTFNRLIIWFVKSYASKVILKIRQRVAGRVRNDI